MAGNATTPETAATETTVPVIAEYIAVKSGFCGGKPHISGHRIKVQHIAVWHERQGRNPDEIVAEHPGLTLADVHAALTYYYDHPEQIDADIQAMRDEWEDRQRELDNARPVKK